jgi:acyl transferase domain-containing protein/acyl-CoA synthetase (AMP-forming)/AMP-acid ligase II/acyl carrier protein
MADEALTRPLHEALKSHAERDPGKEAFRDARRGTTYGALLERTGRFAGHLAARGVGRGDRLAILLDNRVEYAEVLLAGVRASVVGVPVNPGCTDAELGALLDDCDPAVVVTDERHLAQVERVAAHRPLLDVVVVGDATDRVRFEDLVTTEPPEPARDDLGLDETAWILHTSGTTGGPQGVVSTQRTALWSVAACYAPELGLTAEDHLLWPLPMFHSFSHSLCVVGITAVGASARIVSEPALPSTVLRLLQESSATVLAGVPTTYHQFLDVDVPVSAPALRMCVTAGAPLTAELRAAAEDLLGTALHDCYGSTETCGMIAVQPRDGVRVEGSCGPPLPGTRVRVVDPETAVDVPPGADGEIWVRSPGVMTGYHGRPEATAKAVVDGWYRTGDLGRFGEHGHLVLSGRVDDVVIRGGENIHPAEVERVLLGLPGVRDAVVVGRPHPVLGAVPVAFVVPADGGVRPDALRQACARALAEVKVPDEVRLVDRIPRTASGKPLRRVLVAELVSADAAGADAAASRVAELKALTRAERTAVLRDLVRTETASACGLPSAADVPTRTAFTALGVTSLGAVALAERLTAATGLRLSSSTVFDHPDPAAVVDHLEARLTGTGARPAVVRPRPTSDEPVAIVAMACRYPGGVESADDLWRLVSEGVDATGDLPTDRGWDLDGLYDPDLDRIGKSYTRRGGFLHDAADFDAGFFGISPREALATDPQQRLLLEIAWEALENAGMAPASLRGSDTGVFVGLMQSDYGGRLLHHELESHLGIGSAGSVASGRIAYTLGLTGPTLTVDTACSASLVALHLAAKALRDGECSLALAGGVTVMSTPRGLISFSRQRALSPDGRCRSFSDGADGTGWAEGAGILLLERLSDARRLGHPVLAVVRGSAVNSDGASNGLTAPNGDAQRALIRRALADAGLSAADVDVVEGHGTGTTLGDPIEVEALLDTYGQDRSPDRPLWLGSLKSNIGHTQAAAGVGGIIKVVQAMRHGELPRSLHAGTPSTRVDWAAGAVSLLAEPRPWPAGDRPRRAGVSSFGIGGTNAHVVLEEPPPVEEAPVPSDPLVTPWLFSARDEAGVRDLARALAALPDLPPADVGYSLAVGRDAFEHRVAVPADDPARLQAALLAVANGSAHPDVVRGRVDQPARLAFLLTGQGSQRVHLGQRLAHRFPAFREAYDEICALFDLPLRDVVDGRGEPGLLDRTDYAQAAIFAFEVALFRLLESWGVRPDSLVGHSVGELAAAHVAGVLSLPDAVRLVAARGRLMAELPPGGAMIALDALVAEVEPLVEPCADRVAIAAVNGPSSVVISGVADDVARIAERFARTTRLRVSHAFHSPLVRPVLAAFREVAESVTHHAPTIPVVSTVAGATGFDADHWVRHAEETVRFGDAMTALARSGVTAFLEVGPDAVLTALAEEQVAGATCVAAVPASRPEDAGLLAALARLHVRGVPVDWAAVHADGGARRRGLPTYPFQRARYWIDVPTSAPTTTGHPFLLEPVPAADTGHVRHTGTLAPSAHGWLAEHAVGDTVVVPASAFVELALAAAGERGSARLDELLVLEPLTLADGEAPQVQVVVGELDDDRHPFDVYARSDPAGPWTKHVTGSIARTGGGVAPPPEAWPPPGSRPVDLTGGYDRLAARGLRYGTAFQAVTAAWTRGQEVFAEVTLRDVPAEAFGVHPVLLDAALHSGALAAGSGHSDHSEAAARVPFAFTGVELHATRATSVRVRLAPAGQDAFSVTLTDHADRPVVTIESLVTRPLDVATAADAVASRATYRLDWVPVPLPEPAPGGWAVLGEDTPGLPDAGPPESARHLVLAARPRAGLDPAEQARELTGRVLLSVREWLDSTAFRTDARLVVVTHRATAADPDLASAAVWGLVRSAQAENPRRIVLVDLDDSTASSVLTRAIAVDEPQLAVRRGEVHVPRLVHLGAPPAGTAAPRPIDPAGTVLITGGTGALGAVLAEHLVVTHGVRHLLLAGRRGPDAAGAEDLRARLTSLGADVRLVACDTTDRTAVEKLVADCAPALTAVFHLAGVLDDGVLTGLTPERVAAVLAPKATAAWALHTATEHLDLSAFVLYSSASGVFGRPGQGNYAAANAFLDALARHRVAAGLPAQSLAWSLWETEGGMGDHTRRDRATVAITPRHGNLLLDRALRTPEPVLVLAPLDLDALRDGRETPPLLTALLPPRPVAVEAVDAEPAAEAPGAWKTVLGGLPAVRQKAELARLLTAEMALVLGFADAAAFPENRKFDEVGFDSLTAVQLRNRVSFATGTRLSATMVLDHPTLERLTDYVHTAMADSLPRPPVDTAPADLRFAALYHRVIRTRGAAAGMVMRFLASSALPAFTAAERAAHAVRPRQVAKGDRGPAVVFLDSYVSFTPGGTPGLTEAFGGYSDVHVLDHPGMLGDPVVPDSVETLALVHADAVRLLVGDSPVVLVGHCTGGAVAHAVAEVLERGGRAPVGLVLLDTHLPEDSRDDERQTALVAQAADLPEEHFTELCPDSVVLAGGAYARLFDEWRPRPLSVPTFLVRAGTPTASMRGLADWRPRWPYAHDVVDVPGDHQSMRDLHAETTTGPVRDWIDALTEKRGMG